jgi:hypothetical protein
MRVTKRIAEYVTKEVEKAIPYDKPVTDYQAACARMDKLKTEINDKVCDYARKLCEEANASLPEGFVIKLNSDYPVTSTSWCSPMDRAANSHRQKVRDQRSAAVESILVSLELGATKAELANLIVEAVAEATSK